LALDDGSCVIFVGFASSDESYFGRRKHTIFLVHV
jgi:hypothetical protein